MVGGNSFLGGGSGNVATPWNTQYGAWIQPANSGFLQDNIAAQQSYYQARHQVQDLELRRLQIKKAEFDTAMYIKMNTPSSESIRETERVNRLTRARNTPPESEIRSGQALNELLTNIQRIGTRDSVRGISVPLDADLVKHLNVTTTGDSRGSNEFFKPDQIPDWPVALNRIKFAIDRKQMFDDITAMVAAQKDGKVNANAAAHARSVSGVMRNQLFLLRFEVPSEQYAAALEFLAKIDNSIETLAKPGAQYYVNGDYAAKGESVSELVDYMMSKGLTFAKASPGSEPYYNAFHQKLAAFEIGLARAAGDQSLNVQTVQLKQPARRFDD